ncbi:MAG: 2-amino-4-hydroxy-6-hydroxymethyldihydropteridine diphosphokinase [Burkholderiaceae bacterium]
MIATPNSAAVLHTAYIGIGANLGDARASVVAAFVALETLPGTRVIARSAMFRTVPLDAEGDDYVNAVAAVETFLSPTSLLAALQSIEDKRGRLRTRRNAPRPLDLDILLYAQEMMHTPTLTLPHPRLTERAFALIPLLQIAPSIVIPGVGLARLLAPSVAGQGIWEIPA